MGAECVVLCCEALKLFLFLFFFGGFFGVV